MIHLDTHVLVWLYAGLSERFPARALEHLRHDDLAISPMVVLELQYLYEIERIGEPGRLVADDLARRMGIRIEDRSLADVVSEAIQLPWTRDPFDRMICAQALAAGLPLLTADRRIHDGFDSAIWE